MRRSGAAIMICFLLNGAPSHGGPGREFHAVYVYPAGNLWPMHVFVCNPHPVLPANVTVEAEGTVVATATVAPSLCDVVFVTDERKASTTIEGLLAYRITSDVPVYAQQYGQAETFGGTPSAARLPARDELGTEYLVLAMKAGDRDTQPSVVTVVASGEARVTVTLAAPTQAGGMIPGLAKGASYTTLLPAFGVLQLASLPNEDLTGSEVRSDSRVQVFAGCVGCFVPISVTADETLEAMLPEGEWGRRYVVPATYPTTVAPNLIRILARDDATMVTTDPPQPGTPAVLDRGAHLDLITTTDFIVDGSSPVLVGRVEGRGTRDPSDRQGDPALVFLLPEERFITAAMFSLPDFTSSVEQWIDVVTYAGASVVVDGVPVSPAELVPVGSSGFVHVSQWLTFGRTHTVSGDRPLAAYASARHGYAAVSYVVDVGCQVVVPPEVSRSGPPLWLARRGADVMFSWEDMGLATGSYNLYGGTIGTIWDHASLRCGMRGVSAAGGRREATLAVPASGYFLLSASSCGGEGESGADPARSDCPP